MQACAATRSGVLEISQSAPCSRQLAALTAVAISSSSYLVALHTSARRPALGALAARRLAVDCFMVRAIATVLAVRRVEWCPSEAKVTMQGCARPIECSASSRMHRVWTKP